MAKFGGFGGGMGNMQQLMRQAQKMQQEMMEAQEELKTIEVTGTSGGGWKKQMPYYLSKLSETGQI